MNYNEYNKIFEEMAATGRHYIAVDGDIVTMYGFSIGMNSSDFVEAVMSWAKNEGVEFGSEEWCATVDAARFIRKLRMAEAISIQIDELALLEAQESGDD